MDKSKFKDVLIFIWILMLTFIAGMLNIYSIKFFDMTVSHHTGNISNFAVELYENRTLNISFLHVIVVFFIGGVVSGSIFHKRNADLQDSYGITLIICGLIVMGLSFVNNYFVRLYTIVLILGFQNGIFIKFNKVLIRTSHFTGYLTDAGILFGRFLRGQVQDIKNLIIYISSILFFVLGGLFSAYSFDKNYNSLIIIGCVYIFVGMYYFFVRKTYFQHMDSREI